MAKVVVFKPISQDIPKQKTETPSGIPNGQIEQKRIRFSTSGAGGTVLIYTVPEGKTFIIQSIYAYIGSTVGRQQIHFGSAGQREILWESYNNNTQTAITYPKGYWANSGESLYSNSAGGSDNGYVVCGVLVDNSLRDYIIKKAYGF